MQTLKIEEDIKKIVENFSKENFIFDLLLTYGISKATVTLTKKGNSNLAKNNNQIIIKKKLFFEANETKDLHALIYDLQNNEKTYAHNPRFIIVTDYKTLLAVDTKTKQTLDIEIKDLYKRYDFFLPWSGKEKYVAPEESIADRKAAEKMAKIYDEIVHVNPELTTNHNHALNVFLTRLLFCFFAEDTLIFEDNQFTKAIAENTNDNGSDLSVFIEQLFDALDIEDKSNLPTVFQAFPYVNGHLFSKKTLIPKLTANVRKLIIECGEQDWKEINPDILGSMFQAVSINRTDFQQHYTSVPNIMKVINPLFLDHLREEFEKADTENKLRKLLDRIYGLKIFDPACGSGNFLIIAYKQLRIFEMDIIEKIQEITGQHQLILSQIQLAQFYGIEIDDFACEIATLSLWLAEHQMNRKFKDKFGECRPTLPLKASGKIVCGNATRLDWEEVCPKYSKKELDLKEACEKALLESTPLQLKYPDKTDSEIYILGNPPYAGARKQSGSQKTDLDYVFSKFEKYRDLDYISCWFYKASEYIKSFNNIKYAFVSTNSICQGQQLALLWDKILQKNLEISFAYQSFKWGNNAKNNAGVTCVIIGICNKENKQKLLYDGANIKEVKLITPYLKDESSSVIIKQTKTAISNLPKMNFGNMPNDGGGLIISSNEKEELLNKYPNMKKYIRLLLGSQEYIRGQKRYCLWLKDNDLEDIKDIPEILKHIEITRKHRQESKDKGTNRLAQRSHQFRDTNEAKNSSIIIPSVSSERRTYIPCGFLDKETIISNSAQVIYDPEPWVFGVVTSRMHMVWVRAVAGKLETRLRYSAELCYNTFPFPDITDKQKQVIEMHVNNVLEEREKYSDKTMAELYDPDKMPEGLRRAHHDLDLVIESCYRRKPFESDEKRLEYLFKMYEIMTDPSKSQDAIEQLSLL